MHPRLCRAGFTMVELSVVLVIIAIITGMSMYAMIGAVDSARQSATEKKMDEIERALMAYRNAHNRLPCPSAIELVPTDAEYGLETSPKGDCTTDAPGAIMLNTATAVGSIPVDALGLPTNYMYDAWGRKFTYAVDVNATIENALHSIRPREFCNITVFNYKLDPITGNSDYEYGAIYVLLSHGKNGHGGYNINGDQLVVSTAGANEVINSRVSAVGLTSADGPAEYVQQEETPVFDDIVRFKERWQMQNEDDAWRFDTYVGPEFAVGLYQAGSNNVKLFERQCGKYEPYTGTVPDNYTVTLAMSGMAFTQNNTHLIVAHNGTCYAYAISSAGAVGPATDAGVNLSCPAYVAVPPTTMAMSKNGYLAVSQSAVPYVKMWKFNTDKFMAFNDTAPADVFLGDFSGNPSSMVFSRTGQYLAVTRSRAVLYTDVYVRTADRQYTRLTDPASTPTPATTMAFSDDEKFMLMAQPASTNIRIWKINRLTNSFSLLTTLTGGTNTSISRFSRDGQYLVLVNGAPTLGAAMNESIRIYHIKGDTFTDISPTGNFTYTATSFHDAAFSNDSNFLVITVRAAPATQLGLVFQRTAAHKFRLTEPLPGTLNVSEYPTMVRFAY